MVSADSSAPGPGVGLSYFAESVLEVWRWPWFLAGAEDIVVSNKVAGSHGTREKKKCN
jgi:hypothetical protein